MNRLVPDVVSLSDARNSSHRRYRNTGLLDITVQRIRQPRPYIDDDCATNGFELRYSTQKPRTNGFIAFCHNESRYTFAFARGPRSTTPTILMQYPLKLSFKLLTFGQRIAATDASGNILMFVKQKMFKLKEQVEVYADEERTSLIFRIAADRMIDWSANYSFTDAEGNDWGAVRRKGMRSLWSAHYDVMQNGEVDMTIQEESAMKKFVESLLGEIPIIGFFFIYFLNPTYIVKRPDGQELLRLVKHPAIFEGKFTLEKLTDIPEDDELRSLLALMMVVLLERRRG